MPPALPPALLRAIANCDGQVTLIVGAGCSVEPPTSLPLSRDLAHAAHQRLVHDGILSEADCEDSTDLSKVAEAVWRIRSSQKDLVEILPRPRFRSAPPNRGHLIAAALLKEGALRDVVTLNFDLALSSAIAKIDQGLKIKIIPGPERHADLGTSNLIYLHRNVDCQDFDQWILTNSSLADAWSEDRWETVVLRLTAASPVVVFVGLGSRAEALERSIAQIRAAARNEVFLVDPGDIGQSEFFSALNLEPKRYISTGWIDFMEALAERISTDHRNTLIEACRRQAESEAWPSTELGAAKQLLSTLRLLEFGRMRADFVLSEAEYVDSAGVTAEHIADLLLALDRIQLALGYRASIARDGMVEFVDEGNRRRAVVGVASGQGFRSLLRLEVEIESFRRHRNAADQPTAYIVGGAVASLDSISAPTNVLAEPEENHLVDGPGPWRYVTVEDIRRAMVLTEDMIS